MHLMNLVSKGILTALLAVVLVGQGCADATDTQVSAVETAQQGLDSNDSGNDTSGRLDLMLRTAIEKGVTPANAHRAFPDKLLKLKVKKVDGKNAVFVDVLIQAKTDAIPKLQALGAEIRTVTSSGIMTATVPLNKVKLMAALDGINRIQAARSVRLYNDIGTDLLTSAAGTYLGMNKPAGTYNGAGVVVGVIDTGVDWTHKDFIKDDTECLECTPQTRIAFFWDQSDGADTNPPTAEGFGYGHEYAAAQINQALLMEKAGNSDPTATGLWTPVVSGTYPIKASARDTHGHGSHVAGSAAGDGSASFMAGSAFEADIIAVKFDFDNDADRNTTAAIVDGVNYIFKKAAQMGKPAVINMSLGSDYGPHDGTTLEERAIDDLTGPGKVVMVAAGNPGNNNWSPKVRWGYALHGSGALNQDSFTLRVPSYAAATPTYGFFDLFYPAGNKCRVRVTTPSGKIYPPSTTANYRSTWVTGSSMTGFSTAEGGIIVGNGGDQLGWDMSTPDHEVYIEISDYWGTPPAPGTWTFRLEPADSKSVCSGTYHAWYGVSDNVILGWRAERVANPAIESTPRFGGRESDNKVTIGNPASASKVIAVAAYMTRNCWDFEYGVQDGGTCNADPQKMQCYDQAPLGTYDPFEEGELAFFSGRGPRRDGVLKPEIAAPGVGIQSTMSRFVLHAEWPYKCLSYWSGGPYGFGLNRVQPGHESQIMQGTSMATPMATGAVAVLMQKKPDMTDACLRKVFQTTALHDSATDIVRSAANSAFTDSDGTDGQVKPINNDWGYGKLNIAGALAALDAYPVCTVNCTKDSDCQVGYTCKPATDACGCGVCEEVTTPVCFPKGTSCTVNSDCCSNSCGGKPGSRVCK